MHCKYKSHACSVRQLTKLRKEYYQFLSILVILRIIVYILQMFQLSRKSKVHGRSSNLQGCVIPVPELRKYVIWVLTLCLGLIFVQTGFISF
jgi:hypothetical protein